MSTREVEEGEEWGGREKMGVHHKWNSGWKRGKNLSSKRERGGSKEEKQWWESALEGGVERGRVRSDRVTEQREDRKCEGKAEKQWRRRMRQNGWERSGVPPTGQRMYSNSHSNPNMILMHFLSKLMHNTMITRMPCCHYLIRRTKPLWSECISVSFWRLAFHRNQRGSLT